MAISAKSVHLFKYCINKKNKINLSQCVIQIIESVIFLLHFRIHDPCQGIENYKHFWLETMSLLHLALLHLALSETLNVITPK